MFVARNARFINIVLTALIIGAVGCKHSVKITERQVITANSVQSDFAVAKADTNTSKNQILQSSFSEDKPAVDKKNAGESEKKITSLDEAEQYALANNARLKSLLAKYEAAASKPGIVNSLPDPRFGINVFAQPIETAAGSQRVGLTFSQVIPSLAKLNATEQQAAAEALAIYSNYRAAGLNLILDLRLLWSELYLTKQTIEIINANKKTLKYF